MTAAIQSDYSILNAGTHSATGTVNVQNINTLLTYSIIHTHSVQKRPSKELNGSQLVKKFPNFIDPESL